MPGGPPPLITLAEAIIGQLSGAIRDWERFGDGSDAVTENGSVSEPGRSHHPVADRPDGTDSALRSRRAAIADLGDAMRELVSAASATEVGADELRRVAAQVREATAPLRNRTRTRGEMPSADDLLGGLRNYNPAAGAGSALAPPLRIELAGKQVVGRCTLSLAYEGPPTYGHGGISAMLLDQLLGFAAGAAGHPGMTVKLDTRYRAPVPLLAPLRLTAEVTEVRGRRITTRGTITTEAEPDALLVEATGVFIALRLEQAVRLFRGVHPDATDPLTAHD